MGRAYIHLYAHLCYTHSYKKIKDLQIKIFVKNLARASIFITKKKVTMKHLKEANMSYWQHWKHAMLCGIALIIHAWFPWILKDYTSKRICK